MNRPRVLLFFLTTGRWNFMHINTGYVFRDVEYKKKTSGASEIFTGWTVFSLQVWMKDQAFQSVCIVLALQTGQLWSTMIFGGKHLMIKILDLKKKKVSFSLKQVWEPAQVILYFPCSLFLPMLISWKDISDKFCCCLYCYKSSVFTLPSLELHSAKSAFG